MPPGSQCNVLSPLRGLAPTQNGRILIESSVSYSDKLVTSQYQLELLFLIQVISQCEATPFLWLHILMSSRWATIITPQWERTGNQKSEVRRRLMCHRMERLAAWGLANPGRTFTSYPWFTWSEGTKSHTAKERTSWDKISAKKKSFSSRTHIIWFRVHGIPEIWGMFSE